MAIRIAQYISEPIIWEQEAEVESFKNQAGSMAQWEKEPAAKPDAVSSSSRTHMMERQNHLLQVVLWHLCVFMQHI